MLQFFILFFVVIWESSTSMYHSGTSPVGVIDEVVHASNLEEEIGEGKEENKQCWSQLQK
jgi:hypothetical protein